MLPYLAFLQPFKPNIIGITEASSELLRKNVKKKTLKNNIHVVNVANAHPCKCSNATTYSYVTLNATERKKMG